ncbi:MAG: glycosyltransferase family 4 protein [Muribaculaceae bacterium]|nr:glycosyltransferase family 4 protein [Muribaculaceae bacterium]
MKFLSLTTDPTGGGSSKSLLYLLQGLKDKGWEIRMVLPKKDWLSDQLEKINIKYDINPYLYLSIWPPTQSLFDYILYLPRLIKYRWFSFKAKRNLTLSVHRFSPDLIHSNVSVVDTGYKVAKKLNIPHIFHIREYGIEDFNFHFYPSENRKREFLKDSYSICITEDLKRHFDLDSRNKVIYNGIRIKRQTFPTHKEHQDYFLFVGMLTKKKGIFDLLYSYKKYIDNGGKYKLIIAGPYLPKDYLELSSMIKEFHLTNKIDILGSRTDIDSLMQNAAAIIVPSYKEAFGRVLAEGMFNQCVIIGRNTGGLKEQFDIGLRSEQKEIGFRFNNTRELTEIMLTTENLTEEERFQLTEAALQVANKFFSIESNIELTDEFFKNITNDR